MTAEPLYQSPPGANAFPTPSTTPRRPPSMHIRGDSSPGPTTSSPISPPNHGFSLDGRSDFEDAADQDTLSPLDPRRFTPTLHASLVSEILSLRRDVESKTKAIDVLERSLDDSRMENEDLSQRLAKNTKESRSLKHQLNLLEGGTSSALAELAKERDDALENISDVRRKLEQAQKKARSREEDVERTMELWNRDKETWDSERRNLERKVHVVEGRLKVVLNEVAAAQAAGAFNTNGADSAKEGPTGKDSDSTSIHSSSQGRRRTSVTSLSSEDEEEHGFHNARYSVMSVANIPGSKSDGLNLAQELAFDEEEEFGPLDDLEPQSPEALPEERPASVQSHMSHPMGMDAKARKILGLSMDGYGVRAEEILEPRNSVAISTISVVYQDIGIQYSPPPSPTLPPRSPNRPVPTVEGPGDVVKIPLYQNSSTSTLVSDMVSTSCQTVDDLPTPPWTPKVQAPPPPPSPPPLIPERPPMVSTSVQTDETVEADKEADKSVEDEIKPRQPIEIPMIAIHPPLSEPSSPRGSVVLPPQTKSVSCQTTFKELHESRTIGIQTEEIRIDQRPVKLPAALLPSAIPDIPLSPRTQEHPIQPYHAPSHRSNKADKKSSPLVVESSKDPTPRNKPPAPVQAYPGNNDNGPLSDESKSELRRPFRSSSLFAGFDQLSDEESPEMKDSFTDDELLNRPFASYTLRRGRLVLAHERPSLDEPTLPEIDEHLLDADSHLFGAGMSGGSREVMVPSWRAGVTPSGSRAQDFRRAAMITSGATTHQRVRPRSPSEPSIDSGSASGASSICPPFPVPIRLSSRKFPRSGSDGRGSPTPSNPRNFSDRARPSIVRRPTLRRVRSAAAMAQTDQQDRRGSGSSPAMSTSSYAPDSPQHPPLPVDEITVPREKRAGPSRSMHHSSTSQTLVHERHDSTSTSVQPTSVVDAIAQTMVGEWMFKYVRRRRSFGVGESKDNWDGRNPEELSANITNSGVRHKRWVWLAPYERAVMWSSKQPTTGPALLGKSGRKLAIQSVLDVKDDNPLPKGFNGTVHFNRSILILTPARALKFTATSIERHYVWLTALSFLSHSSMGVQDLASLPPVPQEEYERPTPTASLRRNPIRDSIRIAKGKPRPGPKSKRSFGKASVPVPEIPSNLNPMSPVADAADPPTVPRFSNHSRKRSNTAPRMPIPTIRSFSSQATMPSIPSMRSSQDAQGGPSSHGHGFGSVRSSFSHRTSETSVRTGNFFDAIGTVRMEAFIDQTESNRFRAAAARSRHTRKVSSPWSMNHGYPELDSPYEAEYFRHDDPFRGF